MYLGYRVAVIIDATDSAGGAHQIGLKGFVMQVGSLSTRRACTMNGFVLSKRHWSLKILGSKHPRELFYEIITADESYYSSEAPRNGQVLAKYLKELLMPGM